MQEWTVIAMRLIDADNVRNLFDAEFKETRKLILAGETHLDNLAEGFAEADRVIWQMPTVDAVPVVRCKDCASTRKKDDYESIYLGDEVLICTNGKYGWQPVWPNHFCGNGCPRDGEDDAKES